MPVSNRIWGRSGRSSVAEIPSHPVATADKPMVMCRASPWKWWHLGRSVLSRPSLNLIVGTKAFYMNIDIWCSKPPSFAKSCIWTCRFPVLKAKFHVRVVVRGGGQWRVVTITASSGDSFALPMVAGQCRLQHPVLTTWALWSSEWWQIFCSDRRLLSQAPLTWADGCKTGGGAGLGRISRPWSHRKSFQNVGTSTQLLASNKSSDTLARWFDCGKKKVKQLFMKPQYSSLPLLAASSYFKFCERCRLFY